MWHAPWMHANVLGACWKCGGSGVVPKFIHIEGGRCYACDGTGGGRKRREDRPEDPNVAPKATFRESELEKRRLTGSGARAVGKRALDQAARWFRVAERPSLVYPGEITPSVMLEAYKNVGDSVGQAVVDRPLFEMALRRARARVPEEFRGVFESGVRNGITYADAQYAGIDRTIPKE